MPTAPISRAVSPWWWRGISRAALRSTVMAELSTASRQGPRSVLCARQSCQFRVVRWRRRPRSSVVTSPWPVRGAESRTKAPLSAGKALRWQRTGPYPGLFLAVVLLLARPGSLFAHGCRDQRSRRSSAVVPPVFAAVLPAVDSVAYDRGSADHGRGTGDWRADDAYASRAHWSKRHVILLQSALLPPVRRGWLGWGCARWR